MDNNYNYHFFVDTTPQSGTPTWAEVAEGINNLDASLNEVVQKYSFLSGQGWGSSEVTGGQVSVKFKGVRTQGDAAQDYIYGAAVRYNFGDARKTHFKITDPDGTAISGSCTLNNIDKKGGDTTKGMEINFTVSFNGKPTIGNALAVLSVVSAASATQTGYTTVTVTPYKDSKNSYVYKTGTSVDLPAYGVAPSGYTTWDGASDIEATTGNEIAIVECLSDGTAKAGGKTLVVSKA